MIRSPLVKATVTSVRATRQVWWPAASSKYPTITRPGSTHGMARETEGDKHAAFFVTFLPMKMVLTPFLVFWIPALSVQEYFYSRTRSTSACCVWSCYRPTNTSTDVARRGSHTILVLSSPRNASDTDRPIHQSIGLPAMRARGPRHHNAVTSVPWPDCILYISYSASILTSVKA
jgi:hypothetical protein